MLPIKMSETRNSKGWEAHSPAFSCNVEVYSKAFGSIIHSPSTPFGQDVLLRLAKQGYQKQPFCQSQKMDRKNYPFKACESNA
jgi:hypothetical protein